MTRQKKQRLMRSLSKAARAGIVPVQIKGTGKTELMKIKDLQSVLDLPTDECREFAVMRVGHNLKQTKHPYHHKTADGTIVTPDPTLEYLLSRLSEEQRQEFHAIYDLTPEQEANALKALPVDRKYYGHDMYEGHYGR